MMQTIPLFPLSIVVFPGHLVPLHIFEARYRQMIEDCAMADGSHQPFGISFDDNGKVAGTGCCVTVGQVPFSVETHRLV